MRNKFRLLAGWLCLAVAGNVWAAPDLRNGQYVLDLEQGLPGGQPVTLYIGMADGRFTHGWGLPQRYWPIGMDAPNLQVENGRLRGSLVRVAFHAGGALAGAIPKTEAPDLNWKGIVIEYSIEAEIQGTSVTGKFKTKYAGKGGPAEISGSLQGTFTPWVEVEKSNEIATGRDFPCWRGELGNGTSRDSGKELVESWADARLVWRSEDTVNAGYYTGCGPVSFQQGYSAPVVAGNYVYLYYYSGSGQAVNMESVVAAKKERPSVPEEFWKKKFAVKADDIVLCVDARTGRTVWRTVFAEKAENITGRGRVSAGISSKTGCQLTVCAAYGKVLARGVSGGIYCVDGKTGKVAWEDRSGCADITISPCAAGGVFACPVGDGLTGYDPDSGKKLWTVKTGWQKANSPIRWMHKGSEYIIAMGRCMDPKTGTVLWSDGQAINANTTCAANEDYLVSGSWLPAGKSGTIYCFKITPQSITKVWELTGDHNMGYNAPVIYRDHVYGPMGKGGQFICIDLATGKEVGRLPAIQALERCPCSSPCAADGRLIFEGGMIKLDPKDFRHLGIPAGVSWAASDSGSIADGRVFWRTWNGIVCWDLRPSSGREGKRGAAALSVRTPPK